MGCGGVRCGDYAHFVTDVDLGERLRPMAAARAARMGGGLKIGSAGTHQFAVWEDQWISGHPRYVSHREANDRDR